MKKILTALTLLSLSALCYAQSTPQTYSSNNKDGVCDFQKSGHAVADTIDNGNGPEVNVVVGQDDATMTASESMFYEDGNATFYSKYEEKKLAGSLIFTDEKTSPAFNKSCLFKADRLTVSLYKFKKP